MSEHLDYLPLLPGRRAAVRRLDARIGEALRHVEGAAWHLDRLPRPAGAPGTAGLEQVSLAIDELAHGLRKAAVQTKSNARFDQFDRMRGKAMVASDLGTGLHALRDERLFGWLDSLPSVAHADRAAVREHRRAIVSMSPEWGSTLRGWVPSSTDDFAWRQAQDRLHFMLDVDPADAPRQGMWQLAQQRWLGMNQEIDAEDLRAMATSLDGPWMPPWLSDAHGPVALDRGMVADLVVASDLATDVPLDRRAAHYLVNERRKTFARGYDTGRDIVSSMRRLPAELRPEIPVGVEDDLGAALAWARDLRTRPVRDFLGDRPFDEPLLVELLDNDELSALGRVQVARERLADLPVGSEQHAIARDAFDDLSAAFLRDNEWSWHLESADFGRVRASARLLARIAELDVAPAVRTGESGGSVAWPVGEAATQLDW